jgi:methionyl-tRNA formyltransferase
MKIIFFGTPEFAVPFLNALAAEPDITIAAVVTQPDKPTGRHAALTAPAVKVRAQELGLPILQPASLKKAEATEALQAQTVDAYAVVAYGKIIPEDILHWPRLGCLNVHPSLLPKHRGPAPIQGALAAGETQTGISIMLLDAGQDTGPLLAQETIKIDGRETFTTLSDKITAQGPTLLVRTLKDFAAGKIAPTPQDHTAATATKILEREDGRIDWQHPCEMIDRRIRAFEKWPGSWTVWQRDGEEIRLKVLEARPASREIELKPGQVSTKDNRLAVGCLDGTLEIRRLQIEGRQAAEAAQFVAGYSQINGATLA